MRLTAHPICSSIVCLIPTLFQRMSFRFIQPIGAALMLLTAFTLISPTEAAAVDNKKAIDVDLRGWSKDAYVKVVMQYYTVTVSGTTQTKTNYTISKIVAISQVPGTLGTGTWATTISTNALGFSVKATGEESGDATQPKTWSDGFYDAETGITTFYLSDPTVMGSEPIHAPG